MSFSVSKLDIVLFALLAYITLNRYYIQPRFGFSIRYMELIGLSFLYLVLRRISLKNYPWLLLVIVVSGTIQAIYGNLQLLGYYPSNHSGFRMTGSFFNPGPFAGFLAAVWPIAFGMYLFKETIAVQAEQKNKAPFFNKIIKYIFEYILLLGMVSILLVLPASQSRAACLATLASSLILLELRYAVLNKLLKKTSALKKTILTILAIAVLGLGLLSVYHFKKGSAEGRLFIWKVTTKMIADTPVFGVGFDRFKAHYMNAQANYFAEHGETAEAMVADNSYYAFNEFVQFVVENGFVGFLFLVALIVFLLKIKVAHENVYISNILKICLFSVSIFACFSYPTQILPIKIIGVTALAMLASMDVNFNHIKISRNTTVLRSAKVSFLLIAILGGTKVGVCTSTLSEGFKTWQFALSPYYNYDDVIKEYEAAYPLFKDDGDFLMNYGKTLCLAKKYPQAISILQQAKQHLNTTIIETALGDTYRGEKQYKNAEMAYKRAYHMIPSRFYPLYLQAKLYDESGDEAQAVTMAKRLLDKKVKIPSTAIEEMKTEMKTIITKYKAKTSG
ncbi:O-antigen ligase family protein [Jejuia sp. DST062]